MVGENGTPATPEWAPDPQPRDCELERFIRSARVAPEPLPEHIELGEN